MINPDPWTEWKNGKTDGESNAWTDYQKENPVQVTDLSDTGVDPLGAIAGGALSTLIGKGIGAAIGAAFADGGLVKAIHQTKPRTERQAKALRQTRQKHNDFKSGLKFAEGGAVNPTDFDQAANDVLVLCALARQVSKVIDPSKALANDPELIQAAADFLLTHSDEEERQGWIIDFLNSFDPNGSGLSVLNQLIATAEFNHGATDDAAMANGGKVGVKLASGGFLGGNLGIALGAGADEYSRQRRLNMEEGLYNIQKQLYQPQLDTLEEQTAARRSGLKVQDAENQANASMIGDKTANTRMKLANDNAGQEDSAYGRLNQYFGSKDFEGATRFANSVKLPQFGGATVTGFTHDPATGATANLSDGRTVSFAQSSLDRGTKALNGKYDFMTNRVTGDIVRVNDRTGEAEPVIRADGTVNRPLTLPQQSSNQQIEISRQKVAGMAPDELRRRTSKTTDTGRENPDYDPTLAQHVRLAGKRKVGQDDWYDSQGQPKQPTAPVQPQANQGQSNAVSNKFSSDPSMSGKRLGNNLVTYRNTDGQTVQGYEVHDASGRVIGHYN